MKYAFLALCRLTYKLIDNGEYTQALKCWRLANRYQAQAEMTDHDR